MKMRLMSAYIIATLYNAWLMDEIFDKWSTIHLDPMYKLAPRVRLDFE